MKIRRQIVVFDAADLAAESGFWAGLLGGTVEADDDWHSVVVDGEWRLGVQLAPNHVPRIGRTGHHSSRSIWTCGSTTSRPRMRRRSRWARGSCNRPTTSRRPRSFRSTPILQVTRSAFVGRPPTADLQPVPSRHRVALGWVLADDPPPPRAGHREGGL